jgi:cell division septal protein FtsQ
MAERRRSIARARGRRRRTGALAAVGAVAVGLSLWWLATGPVLAIRDVRVTGYERDDLPRLESALEAAASEGTVVRVPTSAIRAASHAFPWVAAVSVRRDLPLGVTVDVVEATPTAVARAAGGAALLVSAQGRVLGPAVGAGRAGDRALARIVIRGPAPGEGRTLSTGLRAGLRFVAALEPDVAGRVRGLRVEGGRLLGRLDDGPRLRLGLPERVEAKAIALGVVLDQIPPEDETVAAYIDLTLPERPAIGGLEPLVEEEPGVADEATLAPDEASTTG